MLCNEATWTEDRRETVIAEDRDPCTIPDADDPEGNLSLRAVEFWQRRTGLSLTTEDAREIMTNIAGFFSVLEEWAEVQTARAI